MPARAVLLPLLTTKFGDITAWNRFNRIDLAVPGSPDTTSAVVVGVAVSNSWKKMLSMTRQSRPSHCREGATSEEKWRGLGCGLERGTHKAIVLEEAPQKVHRVAVHALVRVGQLDVL